MLSQHEINSVCEPVDLADDDDLIELYVRTGEARFVAELIRRHYRLVVTVVDRVVVDDHDAQDAVQTTFLVFMKSAKKIRKRASLAAWLYGVAYRTACRCREQSKRRSAGDESVMLHEHPDPSDSPLTIVARKMQLEALDAELQLVRRSYREVLVEHYLLGHSAAEIAERFSLTQSTVEGRLRRGRRELRMRLLRRGCSLSAATAILSVAHQARASEPFDANMVQQIIDLPTSSPQNVPNHVSSLVAEEMKMLSIASSKFGSGLILFTAASTVLGLLAIQSSGQSDQANGQTVVVAASEDSTAGGSARLKVPPVSIVAHNDPFAPPAVTQPLPAWVTRPATKVPALLDQALVDANYPGTPLTNALLTLSDELNVPIWIDAHELEVIGVDADSPVFLDLPAPLPLGQALKFLLTPFGLSYGVDGDILVISSKEKLDSQPAMRIYELSLLTEPGGDVSLLAQYVQRNLRNIESELWKSEVWNSELLGDKLIVSASEPAHTEIAQRLTDLAQQLGKLQSVPSTARSPQPASEAIAGTASSDPFAANPAGDDPFGGNPFGEAARSGPKENSFQDAPPTSADNPFGAPPRSSPKQNPFGGSNPFQDAQASEDNPFGS